MPPGLCARGSGARWRLDSRSERGRSVTPKFALSATGLCGPHQRPGAVALLRSLGAKGEPWMLQIWAAPRALTTCAIAHPALEGPTVRQEATCVAGASSLAADSEGYEVYYSTNWFIRTLECFTQ